MAVDTRDKRASALGMCLLCLANPALPDGTIGTQDMAQAVGVYSGITIAAWPASASPVVLDPHNRSVTLESHGRLVVLDPTDFSIEVE